MLILFANPAIAAPVHENNRDAIAKKFSNGAVPRSVKGSSRKLTMLMVFLLMKLKLRLRAVNHDERYLLDDPYGTDLGGDGYMESFLSAHLSLTIVSISTISRRVRAGITGLPAVRSR